MTASEMKRQRLESIQKRIRLLEAALENPDSIINLSADGVSETWIPRKDLQEELDGLYKAYERISGSFHRIRTANISRLT